MRETNDFTPQERDQILYRDYDRCLACGGRPATIQHRVAKGIGGRGPHSQPLTHADGLSLCAQCNVDAEGPLQAEALRYGWKVRRFCPLPCNQIPYYDRITRTWWLPDNLGQRRWIDSAFAVSRVRVANGLGV